MKSILFSLLLMVCALLSAAQQTYYSRYDLGINSGWNSLPFIVNIASLKSPDDYLNYYHYINWKGTHTVHLEFQLARIDVRSGSSKLQAGKDGNHTVNNDVEYKVWDNGPLNFADVSIWRQKQRLRVCLNGEKYGTYRGCLIH